MIDREGIVGTLFDELLEILGRAVVIHVVEVVESHVGCGLGGRHGVLLWRALIGHWRSQRWREDRAQRRLRGI